MCLTILAHRTGIHTMSDIHQTGSLKGQEIPTARMSGATTGATMTVTRRPRGMIVIDILKTKLGRNLRPPGLLRAGETQGLRWNGRGSHRDDSRLRMRSNHPIIGDRTIDVYLPQMGKLITAEILNRF